MFDRDRVARILERWPNRSVVRNLELIYNGDHDICTVHRRLEDTFDLIRCRLKHELVRSRQTSDEFFRTAGSYGLDMVDQVAMFLRASEATGFMRPVVGFDTLTKARHGGLLKTWDAALKLLMSLHERTLIGFITVSEPFSDRMDRVESSLQQHYINNEDNWTNIKKFFEHVKGWPQLAVQFPTTSIPSATRHILPPNYPPSVSSVVDQFDALSVASESGGGAVNNDHAVVGNARDERNKTDENDEIDEDEEDTMDLELANIFMTNGRNACREQNFQAAEENFLETLQLVDEGISTDHPKFGYSRWSVLEWVWTSQIGLGKYDAVIASTRTILEDQGPEQSHSHNDLDTASVASFYPDSIIDDPVRCSARYWLAVAYCRKGALVEAEQNALTVLREVRKRFGRGKPEVVNTIDLVVDIYTAMKRPVKAEAYRQFLPADHPKRVKVEQDDGNQKSKTVTVRRVVRSSDPE